MGTGYVERGNMNWFLLPSQISGLRMDWAHHRWIGGFTRSKHTPHRALFGGIDSMACTYLWQAPALTFLGGPVSREGLVDRVTLF